MYLFYIANSTTRKSKSRLVSTRKTSGFLWFLVNNYVKTGDIKMHAQTKRQLKPKLIEDPIVQTWLNERTCDHAVAVTLTLKQRVFLGNNPHPIFRPLLKEDCEKIMLDFARHLNKQVFGSRQAKKYGKKLSYFAVMEGTDCKNTIDPEKRLHIHASIGASPDWMTYEELEQKIIIAAQLTTNVYEHNHIIPFRDYGWIDYMLKKVDDLTMDNILWV
jgi:hypothetical protein